MVEACSQAVLMRKMMKKQMPFMIPLIEEWMIEEKREGMMFYTEINYCVQLIYCMGVLTGSCEYRWLSVNFFWLHFHFREKRFKEEIEQYRQERPKIQQQFSDLKVLVFGVVFEYDGMVHFNNRIAVGIQSNQSEIE